MKNNPERPLGFLLATIVSSALFCLLVCIQWPDSVKELPDTLVRKLKDNETLNLTDIHVENTVFQFCGSNITLNTSSLKSSYYPVIHIGKSGGGNCTVTAKRITFGEWDSQ